MSRKRLSLAARAAGLGLSVALAFGGYAPDALAQSAAELAQARATFQQGLSLEAAGDWAGALAKFQAVGRVKLTPQVRFHIARCKENLGRLNEALGDYRVAEYEAEQEQAKELPAITAAREALQARIPKLVIERGAGAETASVDLDGVELGESKLGKPVSVDPGAHRIVAHVGGQQFEKDVTVAEGQTRTVKLVPPPGLLQHKPAGTTTGPSETPPVPPPQKHSVVPWIVGGVGVASLITSGVFFGLRAKAESDLNSGCRGDVCPERLHGTENSGKTDSVVADVTLGVGLVGVGVAAVMLLTRGSSSSTPPADRDTDVSRRGVRVDVMQSRSATGVSLSGTF
jgi:hypothetical protein